MKKMFVLLISTLLILSMASCQNTPASTAPADTTAAATTVFDNFPKTAEEWTAGDFNNYFKAIGLYTNDEFIYLQDHGDYYPGTCVDECGGYMDNDGLYFTGVFVVNMKSTEADAEAFLAGVRETKAMPEELGFLPVDHMAGNVLFWDSFSADETFYNDFEQAIRDWAAALGVTLDF